MTTLYESDVEEFAIEQLQKQGYCYLSPEEQEMERKNVSDVVLRGRLKTAIDNLNPKIPASACENDEIKVRTKKNIIQSRKLSEMLEIVIKKYQNNLLTAAQVIEELIQIATEIKITDKRGEDLGLSEDEFAFYDALADSKSAKEVLGDETLRELAVILVEKVKANTSIDWTIKESVQAKLRVIVKRILRKYGYPPDKQLLATENILKQAKLMAEDWSES